MKIATWLLLAVWCLGVRCQEEPDILRLTRRRSGVDSGYKTGAANDNKEVEPENYPPGVDLRQIRQYIEQKDEAPAPSSGDSNTGASNSQSAARYVLPPVEFMNSLKQIQQQNYPNQQQSQQNYPNQQQVEQNYPNQQQTQQNYPNQQQAQQIYPNQQQNQQNYPNQQQTQQNYPNQQQPQQNNPNQQQTQQNYPNQQQTQQNYPNQQQTQQNYPNQQQTQQNYPRLAPTNQYVSPPTSNVGPSPVQHYDGNNHNNHNKQQHDQNNQNKQHYDHKNQNNHNYDHQKNHQYKHNQQNHQNDQQYNQNTAASQVHFVSTPAPPHFTSTPRNHYVSSPINQAAAASQVHYVAAPVPAFQSNDNQFNVPQSNVRFVAPQAQRLVQFQENQPAANQIQFVSTPAPSVQYLSTPAPRDHYVSTPVHFVSTASPIQYSTAGSIFGNRLQQQSSSNQDKQMNIDHFDNSMSGVRSPKFPPQNNFFATTTQSPIVISTTISPMPKQNDQYRINSSPSQNLQQFASDFSNVNIQSPQALYQPNKNFQDQSVNLNGVESANYVVNVVHPHSQSRGHHRFQMNRVTQQRDLEKDTDTLFSNQDFGYKLTSKKSSPSYVSSFSDNGQQTLVTANGGEYRPYPDNPFLNHISLPSPATPIKTGSVQSVSFNPDSQEQQNINVGYSIGFGNGPSQESLKSESSSYSNKYSFPGTVQSFTTLSPQNDIVKGVHVSQIDGPDSPFYLKETSTNPQEYVVNALKDKIKYASIPYVNTDQGFVSDPTPYKISHSVKAFDHGNVRSQIISDGKGISYQANPSNIVTAYHGSDGKQSYKWTNISPGVEISSGAHLTSANSLVLDGAESVTPNPVYYMNNPNDVVTNNPFYFASQKTSGGKILQNFDHANALKNIQPIDISNVVYQSATPSPDVTMTVSPQYVNAQNIQLSQIPSGHVIQHLSPDHSRFSTGAPNALDQGIFGYKQVDQPFFQSGKSVIYNVQSLKPKYDGFNDMRTTSFVFNNQREQQAFESALNSQMASQQVYFNGSPIDMIGHASNIDSKQTPNYVPSDAFRNHNSQESDKSEGKSLDSEFMNRIQNYDDMTVYEGRMNQNMDSHSLEPATAGSENNYRISKSNKRSNGEEAVYEHANDVDSHGDSFSSLNGITIANPYNLDMKVISDMLRGKAAIDESRLEPMREQMSRIRPIKLDTSSLRDSVVKNEDDQSEEQETKSYQRHNLRNNYNSYSDFPRPFRSYESEPEVKYAVPNIASEQLQSSLQSVMNSHQIGAVVEQSGGRSKVRSRDTEEGLSNYEGSESDFDREQQSTAHQLNALASSDAPHKQEVNEPYPLLKPPRPVKPQRTHGHKKGEKRPYGARHNRHLGHRHTRPKTYHEIEEFEDYDGSYRIQTELRPPPPVIIKKKSG